MEMCSEYKDARFPSLLMRKRKSSHEWFLYYVDVIKIWNIGLSLLFQVDLALFPAFLMGLWGNVKLHLLGWCCVCVCQCWPRACCMVEKGLGVAGFLGDLLAWVTVERSGQALISPLLFPTSQTPCSLTCWVVLSSSQGKIWSNQCAGPHSRLTILY